MTVLRTRPPRAAVLLVVLLVPALAGCGGNFNPTTDQDYIQARGANARDGDVDAFNVVVVSAADGSGTVVGALVNGTDEDDTLTGVTVAGTDATLRSGQSLSVAARGSLNLADAGAVRATSDDIVPGRFVEVIFSMQTSGSVTVEAPVVPHENEYADVPVDAAEE